MSNNNLDLIVESIRSYLSATDKANVGDGEVPAVVSAKHTTSPAIVTFSRVDQFSGAVNGIIYVEIALY